MPQKRRKDKLAIVTYEYVGTDREFDAFLRLLIHDYLALGHPAASQIKATDNSLAVGNN